MGHVGLVDNVAGGLEPFAGLADEVEIGGVDVNGVVLSDEHAVAPFEGLVVQRLGRVEIQRHVLDELAVDDESVAAVANHVIDTDLVHDRGALVGCAAGVDGAEMSVFLKQTDGFFSRRDDLIGGAVCQCAIDIEEKIFAFCFHFTPCFYF